MKVLKISKTLTKDSIPMKVVNFHSLTYLVTYPENPNLYVNLIFFSNDFVHYHPVIYKYNLSAAELKRDIIINKDKIFPIRIGEGQNYLDALDINKEKYQELQDKATILFTKVIYKFFKEEK